MNNNIITKTFIFYVGDDDNDKLEIEGIPKIIEITKFGVHSTDNDKKVLCEIDLGNFIPSMNYLYCHAQDDNHFLTESNIKFSNIKNFNGSFKPKVKNINNNSYITGVWFVLYMNLYY